ncbi:MAG TPA: hypothetical protein GX697_04630 [Firmicutes bacterium]|nr:hypothetical protein [Bacillota bacterium]
MELIVFIIMMILAFIMKSSQGSGKSSTRSPASRGEKLKKLEDILSAEIERAKQRKFAPQYNREHDRQYERQEDHFPAAYRSEMQQPVLKQRSERKKRPVPEPSSAFAPAASSTARPLKESMQRPKAEKEDNRRMQEQLVDLLGSEKIALGIVASEVLSPPRARRLFQYRR